MTLFTEDELREREAMTDYARMLLAPYGIEIAGPDFTSHEEEEAAVEALAKLLGIELPPE
jgi:hypothetical protein